MKKAAPDPLQGIEWPAYQSTYGGRLEAVSWILWDTERYRGGGYITEPPRGYALSFFQSVKRRLRESNMQYPGMIPAPNAFLVEEIRIKGVTRKMGAGGVVELIIGNKICTVLPLDDFTRHQHFIHLSRPLMIASLVRFELRLSWEQLRFPGFTQPKIEVQLSGSMVRPVQ